MTLKTKIIGSYVPVFLLFCLLGGFSIISLGNFKDSYVDLNEHRRVDIEQWTRMERAILRVLSSTNEYALISILEDDETTREELEAELQMLRAAKEDFQAAITTLKAIGTDEPEEKEEEDLIVRVDDMWKEFTALSDAMINTGPEDTDKLAEHKEKFEELETVVLSAIHTQILEEERLIAEDAKVVGDTYRQSIFLTIVITAISGFLVLAVGVFISRDIALSLDKLNTFVDAALSGKSDTDVPFSSNDEFGKFAHAFGAMVKNVFTEQSKAVQYAADLEKTNSTLTEKMNEIEKINKFMIDRELKIVELKKDVERLKSAQDKGTSS